VQIIALKIIQLGHRQWRSLTGHNAYLCISSGDGKKLSLLGFGSVRVLPKVRFGLVRVLCKHGKFKFGSGSVLV